jgi:hypothetical protein
VTERRWPLFVAAVVAAVVIAGAAWAAGRASAPDTPAARDSTPPSDTSAIRMISGVPIGVQRSRAGALAAADNYVATSSETVIQDPARFETFIRESFTEPEAAEALADAKRDRERAPDAVENYANGGRGLSVVAARRLDAYDGTTARTTSWNGGIVWGPGERPRQRWFLVETSLRWDGDRWRITDMEETSRPAPAPAIVGYNDKDALKAATFDRELRAMTAPIYGTSR